MMADAAHLIAVPAVVADHLRALVRDMLGDGSQKVGGGEDLEVAVDLGIEAGAVDDHVGRGTGRSGGGQSATAATFSDFWRDRLALVHPPA